jgi:hypothetical protein
MSDNASLLPLLLLLLLVVLEVEGIKLMVDAVGQLTGHLTLAHTCLTMVLPPPPLLLLVLLVVVQVEGMELMVDAFNGGELTALQDAEEVLGRLMGYQVI